MMLEMEAELPLSNAQLYAEMKKEMRGAGGPTLHVCCLFFFTIVFHVGVDGLGGKRESRFFLSQHQFPLW